MSIRNQDLVQEYFRYFNNHDWEKMADMYTEEAKLKDPSFGIGIVKQTRQQTIQKYAELEEVFPDLHDEVIQIYHSGEQHVIVEFISTGTALDGTAFALPVCTIFTIENGQITQDFTYYDNFEE